MQPSFSSSCWRLMLILSILANEWGPKFTAVFVDEHHNELSFPSDWKAAWKKLAQCVTVWSRDILFSIIYLSRCHLIHCSPLLFPLCFPQTLFIMWFNNQSSLYLLIFSYDEHLSPKAITQHLVPWLVIVPSPSSMFHDLVCAQFTIVQKPCCLVLLALSLDLCNRVFLLASHPLPVQLLTSRSCPVSIAFRL